MKKFLFSIFLVVVLLMGTYWGAHFYKMKGGEMAKFTKSEADKIQLTCTPHVNISTFLGQEWINYTSKRLHLAECPMGGFTDIDDTITPDIISTYYFVSALRAINQSPYNKAQTVNWLHENENNLFENATESFDKNLVPKFWIVYYGVMTLSMLNSSPKDPAKIVEFILNLRQKNGSFMYQDMDLTPQSVEILHALGYNLSSLKETKKYCLRKFQNLTPPGEYGGLQLMGFLFNFIGYTKCLRILGVNYTKTQEYWSDVQFIDNLSKNVGGIIKSGPPLFIVAKLTQLLREYDLLNGNISREIYSYVISQELPDGGFNLFGKDYGEFQGTYYAVTTIALLGKRPDRKTIEFIHSWESPLGGFAFTSQNSCGSISTYQGVYVAEKTGIPINKTRLRMYLEHALRNRWPYSQDNPAALDAIYLTYRQLNLTIEPNDMEYLKNETVRLMKFYLTHKKKDLLMDTGWRYLIKLGNSIGVKLSPETKSRLINEVLSMRNTNGTFGPPSNNTAVVLYRTENAVLLLHALGYNYTNETTAKFILSMQHDGGWGAPDIFNTRGAVKALAYMGYCPKDVQGLISFVYSLKYKYGGFLYYRGDKGYGSIQATYYAIRILELIGAVN